MGTQMVSTGVVEGRNKRWMYITDSTGTVTHICDTLERKMYDMSLNVDVIALFNRICNMQDLNAEYYEMLRVVENKVVTKVDG